MVDVEVGCVMLVVVIISLWLCVLWCVCVVGLMNIGLFSYKVMLVVLIDLGSVFIFFYMLVKVVGRLKLLVKRWCISWVSVYLVSELLKVFWKFSVVCVVFLVISMGVSCVVLF